MWGGLYVQNLFWRLRFLHITAKIRLVMGSYFHQSFLLILSTTFYFGFFRHLRNVSNILQKMGEKLKKKFKTPHLWKKSWVIEAKVNDLPFKISSTSKNEFKFLITALHFDF